VYAATSDDDLQPRGETLSAFDTGGERLWTAQTGDPREASVTPGAAVPYGVLQVVDADGTERVRTDRFRDVVGGPAFVDDRLLVASHDSHDSHDSHGGLHALAPDGTEQ